MKTRALRLFLYLFVFCWMSPLSRGANPAPPYDFTGDNKPDILWRRKTTAETWLWPMNGVVYDPVAAPAIMIGSTGTDTNWKIVGVGDFNGDGKQDIFWEHMSLGILAVWYMNGTSIASTAQLSIGAAPGWHI